MSLKPLNFNTKSAGTALVELKEQGAIDTPDKQFKSFHQGMVIDLSYGARTTALVNSDDDLVGKLVYFEEYKDSCQVEEDDKIFAFIALEDIKGYQD